MVPALGPIRVEVVYALPRHSVSKSLQLERGATVGQALAALAGDADFSGVDLENSAVGIFGRVAGRDAGLEDGDRIELYRPLMEEPKLARRRRARPQKAPQ